MNEKRHIILGEIVKDSGDPGFDPGARKDIPAPGPGEKGKILQGDVLEKTLRDGEPAGYLRGEAFDAPPGGKIIGYLLQNTGPSLSGIPLVDG